MAATIVGEPPAGPPKNLLESLPGALPMADIQDDQASLTAAIKACTQNLRIERLAETDFTPDAIWRDTYALTGTLRTFYSPSSIAKAWRATSSYQKPGNLTISASSSGTRVVRLPNGAAWVDVSFAFTTAGEPRARCSGIFSVVPAAGGQWKIWVLKTVFEQLRDGPSVDELSPVSGEVNGHGENDGDPMVDADSFDCVVVGGGQAGLSTGGRLKALGISYVVIDKQANVGDSWNSRYDSVKVHTTREYAHLPFDRTFPLPYSRYLTKAELARGYQDWVKRYGINVWTSTELKTGSWDQNERKWTLMVQRGEDKEEMTISCSHVVMSVGGGGQLPLMPNYPGQDTFRGLILHSSQFQSAKSWVGLNGVVVGTANTAHDVAEDMVEANLKSTTMIQRHRTYILPAEHWAAFSDTAYNDSTPTEDADRSGLSAPNVISGLVFKAVLGSMASAEPERFDALEKVGFKTEVHGDLAYHLLQRMGGHYMDMGNCKNITDGLVKMKSDALIKGHTPDGIEFDDGSQIPADVIVYATGFASNVRDVARDIFGKEVASKLDDFWGLDDEGELKGLFKRMEQPGFWYMGGTMSHARYMSRHVALQIKADLLGTPYPIYNETP